MGAALAYIAIAVAAAPSTPAQSPTDDPGWEKRSDQWFEKIEPGGEVRVVNPYGNIYARFGGYEPRVEILATTQIIDRSAPALFVRREPVEGDLDVHVIMEGFSPADTPPRGDRKDRVDLVVFVPKGSTARLRTAEGSIQAKGLKSDVDASTSSGDIQFRETQGHAGARSVHGAISAMLLTGATDRRQWFRTQTGDIEVFLWEDAAAEVRLATSGLISTDFSLAIEHRPLEEPDKLARASIGSNGPEITLESKRGGLRLLRLPTE